MRFLVLAFLFFALPASANQDSSALRERAFTYIYNLDYDLAARDMEEAAKADSGDVAAQRGLAQIPWLVIAFQRGTLTVDEYLGRVTKQNVALREPPPDLASRFHQHASAALALAEQGVAARPLDPEAYYQLGAIVALQASYTATVEGRVFAAFRAARRAYDAHERVLALDPTRKDAGLIVGIYRYVVSELSLPVRMMAYMAGFGGGKERGIRMIEEAAAYGGGTAPDARFALVLLYNRERRWDDALNVLADLRREFPRNRILWLESGATALRAGRPDVAERLLEEGHARFNDDPRPRMFGEEALWRLKRGTARVALNRDREAEEDLRRAVELEARKWVTGRAHTELGKIADLRGDRATARREFEQAVALAQQDNDPIGEAQAERWLRTPYRRQR